MQHTLTMNLRILANSALFVIRVASDHLKLHAVVCEKLIHFVSLPWVRFEVRLEVVIEQIEIIYLLVMF